MSRGQPPRTRTALEERMLFVIKALRRAEDVFTAASRSRRQVWSSMAARRTF